MISGGEILPGMVDAPQEAGRSLTIKVSNCYLKGFIVVQSMAFYHFNLALVEFSSPYRM